MRFGDGDRALYSTDNSNYRQIPIGVVIPRDRSDMISTVAACRQFGAPITCRGGGTSLAGQCCNVAVVIDFTKYMNHVIEIDVEKKLARVEPGLILDDLQNKLNLFRGIAEIFDSIVRTSNLLVLTGNNLEQWT